MHTQVDAADDAAGFGNEDGVRGEGIGEECKNLGGCLDRVAILVVSLRGAARDSGEGCSGCVSVSCVGGSCKRGVTYSVWKKWPGSAEIDMVRWWEL